MIKKIIYLFIIVLLLGSCASKKDILFYQDIVANSQNQVQYLPNTVQVNDILYIKVISIVPESVEPFNIQLGNSNATSPSLLKLQGYLVLEDGTIAFSKKLWNYSLGNFGFDAQVFDSQYFDETPQTETRYIIRALNEEIYVGDLEVEGEFMAKLLEFIIWELVKPLEGYVVKSTFPVPMP